MCITLNWFVLFIYSSRWINSTVSIRYYMANAAISLPYYRGRSKLTVISRLNIPRYNLQYRDYYRPRWSSELCCGVTLLAFDLQQIYFVQKSLKNDTSPSLNQLQPCTPTVRQTKALTTGAVTVQSSVSWYLLFLIVNLEWMTNDKTLTKYDTSPVRKATDSL